MTTGDALQFGLLIILLALSAFFSSAETAMTTVNRIRIKTLSDGGDKRASMLLQILENSPKMLSAILIGNNIVNISASSLATTLTLRLFGSTAVSVSTGVLTLLVLIFGEITPKNLATASSEKLSLAYSPVILFLMRVMTPLIFIVDRLSRLVLKFFHASPDAKADPITEDDLRTLVDVGHEDGAIESEERRMINNVFDFGDALATDIMIPRADMVCINEHDSYLAVLGVFRREKFTRLPVCRGDRDNIVGILNIKDFAFIKDRSRFRVNDLMYEPYFTYENKKISELLIEMREKSISMTIVLDEYGAVSGLITLEDLLEELVGEIRDEYDKDEENLIRKIGADEYIIEGAVKIDDLNDALGTDLGSDDYDSVGGYIIEKLDHLPSAGEKVTTPAGSILRVDRMDKNRIDKVHLFLAKEMDSESSEN